MRTAMAEAALRQRGPWTTAEILHFLEQTLVPVRLAANGANGHPLLLSLWFAQRDGRIWCATQRDSRIATLLARDPRCAFEVAPESPPYRGVRGQALASLHEERGAETLSLLIDRYLGDRRSELARWLLGRAENETAIALEPRSLVSWDYRVRMGAA
jgi:nitroimidazol reductase NimA-like FMN-containing flavoprotein (pyridoxamine 5'-phosphate oxidase superfamily)